MESNIRTATMSSQDQSVMFIFFMPYLLYQIVLIVDYAQLIEQKNNISRCDQSLIVIYIH